jgi:RNA polymerase sigma factor (sigma-70 family)
LLAAQCPEPGGGRHNRPGWDADQALAVLYDAHYRALIQLAVLLAGDVAIAEEMVQDAFVAMHGAWRQLRDSDKALCYLQQAVIRRSRSSRTAHPTPPSRRPDLLPDGQQAITHPEARLMAALRALPAPQREALVLRYYADLPATQIATAMGIRTRTVDNHIAHGMSSLQAVLEPRPTTAAPQPNQWETPTQPMKPLPPITP